MAGLPAKPAVSTFDRRGMDSLLLRRIIGGAFVMGLAALGLAFPMII
jgi:hypothetical protein